jgi:type I restriction enzyme M protein
MEEIRSALHEEIGDELFTDFAKVASAVEKRLSEWGSEEEDEGDGEDEEEEEETPKKKGLPEKKKKKLLEAKSWERDGNLYATALMLRNELGGEIFPDHNQFRDCVDATLKKQGIKLGAAEKKALYAAVSWRDESAPPVIATVHKLGKATPDPLHGLYEAEIGGKKVVVEYEPDSELRDSEQIPLLEEGGIEAFFSREVLPYTSDAWIKQDATKVGYEVSFTRHFYKPQPLRTLEEIRADIMAVEKEAEGLLEDLLK